MVEQEQKEMKQVIAEKIEEIKQEITSLKELTKPVEPDNAYGRLSRMDAINNKTINDKALHEQKSRLQKLERAQTKLQEDKYGVCIKCGDDLPLGCLKFMPWTARCVKCARKG